MVGGTTPDANMWKRAVNGLAQRVQAARVGHDTSPLRLNVVYQIPGDVVLIDFAGVRSGRFSRPDRHLLIQAAVPIDAPSDPEVVLVDLLRQAIAEAERFGHDRGLFQGTLQEVRSIVDTAAGDRA